MESTSKVIRSIPLTQIRPSRNNPRRVIRQDMVDARAASMAQSGQSTPIKVRALTPDEKASALRPQAEGQGLSVPIPGEKGIGAQETSPEVLYEIIDGELRYRAALKNGWQEIEAQILDISPKKAFQEAIKSNRINMPGWFEDYLAMEQLEKEGELQKQEIAALFEVHNNNVGRALKILGVLNQACRDLVLQNLEKPPGEWKISENALFRLTDLGAGDGLERALRVALDRQLSEPQA
jgi:hypothetical protein